MKDIIKSILLVFITILIIASSFTGCSGSGGSSGESDTDNIAVTGVTLKSSTSLLVGGTEQLFANIEPSSATNQNVTWSTFDAGIASVSKDGFVTGIAAGSETVTVTTEDGGFTADCAVTVSAVAVESPVFSIQGGLFDSPVIINISSTTPDATIRYTTDGSDPSETNGNLYTDPINIAYTIILKSIACKTNWIPSNIVSQTYMIRSQNLDLTIRDFTPSTNIDFEYDSIAFDIGIVNDILGLDKKPVYNHTGSTTTVHSASSFSQWFSDVEGTNYTINQILDLDNSFGELSYYDSDYFPIDELGFGYTPGYSHNYHFTVEIHSIFYYEGYEDLNISANDDTWVFINNKLAIDLGGIHSILTDSITLDNSLSLYFGLESGNIYNIDIFHAQRHTTESNFNLSTNLILLRNNTN